MQEFERDTYSNQCITDATNLVNEAKALLKDNQLKEAILNDYKAIFLAMRAILAVDDNMVEDDMAVDRAFRSGYIDNGMTSEEMSTTLDKIQEYVDKMHTEPDFKIGKPDAGYFTSKANFFIMEITDNIVQRNALYWGQ